MTTPLLLWVRLITRYSDGIYCIFSCESYCILLEGPSLANVETKILGSYFLYSCHFTVNRFLFPIIVTWDRD
ncbi:hypothetical protein GLOIN_2v1525329 [Rhizophagus irregularis DAOM 181602=DAOM 197198]|uniref:Uncharacterized protein n=1 Tax=Rhizophagus irregularis (strain DAOM 181602 / DAOM 197198 / MUCL 43194) TaxID=747089 RepID=A0A2P4QPW8_RHIID|nr:hypothetical protein GLOIN_2v1525329 [Rhizophagus irregularis DAOM 181602=DAOM 197198]POG79713.1 hypothetical protein GLOIN_2v1525329 [Rhizophagus irregularis DAOM 181602=DAOM 197198]GET62199.1 hypothetical protein GLOIN_2v1525329 [Rhizophagus irregularis DAOM 181602=DAOM 197198]|eukprot:XP_025186579.1 hypothetical protein GLOIN_2v1525329 [Rhizophagus irregularis DAOM 181602=DAOM 197198]